jgi:putative toxin-antitoxin system antitoxin component (TIGR02293 family)
MKAYASTLRLIGVQARSKTPSYRVRRSRAAARGELEPTSVALVDLEEQQVPFASIHTLARRIGIDPAEMLAVIGMPERTAARRREQGLLKPDEADRLLRVARVVEEATRIFGSEEKAARWLQSEHPLLSDAKPFSLLDSDAGVKSVTDELTRIDYGDFA